MSFQLWVLLISLGSIQEIKPSLALCSDSVYLWGIFVTLLIPVLSSGKHQGVSLLCQRPSLSTHPLPSPGWSTFFLLQLGNSTCSACLFLANGSSMNFVFFLPWRAQTFETLNARKDYVISLSQCIKNAIQKLSLGWQIKAISQSLKTLVSPQNTETKTTQRQKLPNSAEALREGFTVKAQPDLSLWGWLRA